MTLKLALGVTLKLALDVTLKLALGVPLRSVRAWPSLRSGSAVPHFANALSPRRADSTPAVFSGLLLKQKPFGAP